MESLYVVFAIIVAAISSAIVTFEARQRMEKSLGKRATDLDLASLKSWMQVVEVEEREQASQPIHPK
jgi:hypothetical protein